MDLVGMYVRDLRRKTKFTVLKRPNGNWSPLEVGQIVCGLPVELQQHQGHPEFLVLLGEFNQTAIEGLLKGKKQFEYRIVTGYDNPELPFRITA